MKHCCLILFALAAARQAAAGNVTYNLNFAAVNQAMFGSGAAQVQDRTYLAGAGWDESDSKGSIDNTLGIRDGAKVSASTSGFAGVQFDFQMNSGSVNAQFPASVGFTMPDTVLPGQRINIGSSVTLGAGGMTTQFPGFGIGGSMVLNMAASANLDLCVLDVCGGGGIPDVNIDFNSGMFSYNLDGSNKLKVFGLTVPVYNFGDVINLPPSGIKVGDLELDNPNLGLTGDDTTIQVLSSFDHGVPVFTIEHGLLAEGKVDMLTMHADIANFPLLPAATLGVPVPALSVGVDLCDLPGCTLRADIAEVNVGVALGVKQTLFLQDPTDIDITMTLRETGETHRFPAGSPVSFTAPTGSFDELHFDPVFSLRGPDGDLTFSNSTELSVVPDIVIDALKVCGGGICLGPLFDYHKQLTEGELDVGLVNKNFDLNLPTIRGGALTIANADPPPVDPGSDVPEPGTLVWAGAAIAAMVLLRRITGSRTASSPAPQMR